MNIKAFFDNSITLYITLGIAVINILGYLGMASISCVFIFLLGTYISNRFITGMVSADILIGLFISNILFSCGGIKEGLI